MSNNAIINAVSINDVNAIRAAVDELKQQGVNIALKENAKQRSYFTSQEILCPYVLHLPDCRFDVGLKAKAGGGYEMVCDLHNGLIAQHLGTTKGTSDSEQKAVGRFLQTYAKHAAMNAATAAGHMIEQCYNDEEGNVQILAAV